MECFKCHRTMYQNKSEYGFYYRCPSCGRIVETRTQTKNNQAWFKSRVDYNGQKNNEKKD